MRILTLSLALALPASAALAMDDCLVGTWAADLDDLAHIMGVQMNGTARTVGGAVSMQIAPDGAITTLVDDLVVNVAVPNVPAMDVKVVGSSSGGMTAEDGAWAATIGEYDLVGAANVMGQTMEIPFSSSTGMFGGGLGTYGCTADTVAFDSTGETPRIPRRWTRIE